MTEPALPLRERKKRLTRQHISDVATSLFALRGFDAVTVAEIADAAGVSKMTVFNYFPRKEDLFFDRGPEAVALLSATVRERAADETPIAALRRVLSRLAEQGHPLGGVGDGFAMFWRVMLESPALRARAREAVEELEGLLVGLFAEADGVPPAHARPRLAAALTVAAYRTVYTETANRLLAGASASEVLADHMARLEVAFDVVERGLVS